MTDGIIQKVFDYWESLGHKVDRQLQQELIAEIKKEFPRYHTLDSTFYSRFFMNILIGDNKE